MKKKQVKKPAKGIKVKTSTKSGSLMNELLDKKASE